jgi:hypothetical protein
MTIKKSDFLLNFMMFCLGATVGRRIGDPYLMRHLAAKLADLMLVKLPYCTCRRPLKTAFFSSFSAGQIKNDGPIGRQIISFNLPV